MNRLTLDAIRHELGNNVGKKVRLRVEKGRKRVDTSEGILESVYPSVFVVKVENDFEVERTVSYTYSDVLTSTVKLSFCS